MLRWEVRERGSEGKREREREKRRIADKCTHK